MTPERWNEVRALLHSAMQVPIAERSCFLDSKCSHDLELREEVVSLLAEKEALSDSFLENAAQLEASYRLGTRLGSYEIVSFVGAGGMGEVYQARDTRLDRIVAIKLLPTALSFGPLRRRQLKREAQAISLLQHPNICTFYQLEQHENIDFLVMEYVAGLPIDKYCDSRHFTVAERLKLFDQVCGAVHYAHQHLIIHRDLKPGNILISSEGLPKLLDFGLAKILDPFAEMAGSEPTVTLNRAFTPAYASPEQMKGAIITTASDVYSLGVILYELLTGRSPYRNVISNPEEFIRSICELKPEKPSTSVTTPAEDSHRGDRLSPSELATLRRISPEKLAKTLRGDLDNIVIAALRKEPERRYASVEQLAQDIQRHLNSLPISARKDTFRYRTTKFVNRHKISVSATAVIALTLLSALVITLHANREARLQAAIARSERSRAERRFNDVRTLANTLIFDLPGAINQIPGAVVAQKMLYDNGLKYLDSLAAEAGGDRPLQRELAAGYKGLGDSQGFPYGDSLGDSGAALVSYRKSIRIREQLLQGDPDNVRDRIDIAKLHRTIGALLTRTGKWQQGKEEVNKALAIIQPIAVAHDDNTDALRELGNVLLTIGGGYDGLSDAALKYHLQAMGVFRKLASRQPAVELWQRQIGYMDQLISEDYLRSGKPSEAMRCGKEALQIYNHLEKNADDSTKAQLAGQMAVGHATIGAVLSFTGHTQEALAEFKSEHDLFQIYDPNPKDKGNRANAADTYINLGHAESRAGDLRRGLLLLRRGADLIGTLRTGEGTLDTWTISTLVDELTFEGETLEDLGEEDAALKSYEKALRVLESPALNGKNTFRTLRATVYVKIGSAHARVNHRTKARDAYRRALELLNTSSQPISIEAKYSLISLYAGLGDLFPTASCPLYRKSLAIWKQLPVRNSVSPEGFKVVEFREVSRRIEHCK